MSLNPVITTEGIDEFFDPPLEDKYKCPICLLGLREPCQTQCGHRFCRGCITRSLRVAGNKCPVDNLPLSESGFFPDNFAKKGMEMLTVWCRHHKERGCEWKGTLNDLEKHLETCKCVEVTCEYCGNMVLFIDIKSHYKECPKYEITCSKCGEKVANEKIANHRERVFPKEIIKCPLEFLGCKEENFIPEINSHLADNITSHIFDLAKAFKTLQLENQAMREKIARGSGYRHYDGEPDHDYYS